MEDFFFNVVDLAIENQQPRNESHQDQESIFQPVMLSTCYVLWEGKEEQPLVDGLFQQTTVLAHRFIFSVDRVIDGPEVMILSEET